MPTVCPLAPFCSAALRPLVEAYRSVAVLLEMVAVVGLVEFELPPVDVGVVLDRIKRAPSGLSGVFTRSFVTPEDKNLNLPYQKFELTLLSTNSACTLTPYVKSRRIFTSNGV